MLLTKAQQFVLILLGVCGLFGVFMVYQSILMSTESIVDCTVKRTESVGGQQSKYLIFCQEEVFQNTDEMAYMKFNSSDVYNGIEQGKKYTFQVVGWRYPFLSWYRNIISIK